jgi:hypothetical protein
MRGRVRSRYPQFDTNTEQQPLLKKNPAETGFQSREEASSTREFEARYRPPQRASVTAVSDALNNRLCRPMKSSGDA